MKRKLVVLLLALSLMVSFAASSVAADEISPETSSGHKLEECGSQ